MSELNQKLLTKIGVILAHNSHVKTGKGAVEDALVEFDLTEEDHNVAMLIMEKLLGMSKTAEAVIPTERLVNVAMAAGLLIGKVLSDNQAKETNND